MKVSSRVYSVFMTGRIPSGEAHIQRKEANDNVLHDSVRTTDNDDDDTARARDLLRFLADGAENRAEAALKHELDRGHRRKWQAAAPHALDPGRDRLELKGCMAYFLLTMVYCD
jgi:hypothetical protein